MTIKGIKLTTGDELVANVLAENADGSLLVENPLMIIMQPDVKQGGMVCTFYPWTIINKGDILIQGVGVVAHYTVPSDVEVTYMQNTSNLQIVSGAAAATQILHG